MMQNDTKQKKIFVLQKDLERKRKLGFLRLAFMSHCYLERGLSHLACFAAYKTSKTTVTVKSITAQYHSLITMLGS